MPRKLPSLTQDTTAFWQGGASGALLMHRCGGCERYFHPPAPVCPRCASLDVAPHPVSGRGTVATFTVNHQAWSPSIETPYVVAVVELDEQEELRMVTNIVGCEPDLVRIGMPVHVHFENQEDVWLPLFRPARLHGA